MYFCLGPALIRAYWTPHKLLLQQRVNKNELHDKRVVMNERLATFDGPEHLNTECAPPPRTRKRSAFEASTASSLANARSGKRATVRAPA